MKNYRMKNYRFIFTLFIMSISMQLLAQDIKVNAYVDTNMLIIGEQTNFYLQIIQPKDKFIQFPEIDDELVKNIEILAQDKIDTGITQDQRLFLSQKFVITSFEDTLYTIPPFIFTLGTDTFKTDSFQIAVNLMPVDSTFYQEHAEKLIPVFDKLDSTATDSTKIAKIFDNPENYNIEWTFQEFWRDHKYKVIIPLIILILTALIIYIIKRKKDNKPIIKIEKPKEPAHFIALRKLEKLKEEKLWQQDLIKQYYTQLTDIFREYIENRFDIATFERTSAEIIISLEISKLVEKTLIEKIKFVLFTSDAVKFAKGLPLSSDNDISFDNILFFVKTTAQTINVNNQKTE